ncbi:MAG: hypothetical protein IJ593_00670 [Lachnospiraceae bacterium]|nr:hypothetical protein [Lachnospiraceae bacterium]
MSKLNYDRDVAPSVKHLNTISKHKFKIKSNGDKWELYKNDDILYTGTLRECYCIVFGETDALE